MSLRRTMRRMIQRLDALEAVSRQRALTDAEADELATLEGSRARMARMLVSQIATAEASLLRLRAELAVLTPAERRPVNGRRATAIIIDESAAFRAEMH